MRRGGVTRRRISNYRRQLGVECMSLVYRWSVVEYRKSEHREK